LGQPELFHKLIVKKDKFMKDNKLFRLAGWAALVIAVLMVAVNFVQSPVIGTVVQIIATLVLLFIYYALYVAYRSQSAGLSMTGLVLYILAFVVGLASLAAPSLVFLGGLIYVGYALPLLVFGILAFQSARMPRALAILTLLDGALWLIAGVSALVAKQDHNLLGEIAYILMVIWLVWLGWAFLKGKLASAVASATVVA
jgi:hypothetical protein